MRMSMEMTTFKSRNYLLDNMKVILIFLVVFGHLLERYINNMSLIRYIYVLVYSFHMPLFVFISGYFSKNYEKCNKRAVRDFLIPYAVFNVVWYMSYGGGLKSLYYPGWALWYMLCLFYWRFLLKYLLRFKAVAFISVLFGVCSGGIVSEYSAYLSLSRALSFLPFFLLGYHSNDVHLEKIKQINGSIVAIASIFILSFLIYFVKGNYIDYKFLYMSMPYKYFGLDFYQGVAFRVLFYVFSVICCLVVIWMTPSNKMFFSYIGSGTLMVYLLHTHVILKVNALTIRYDASYMVVIFSLLLSIIMVMILSHGFWQKIYDLIFKKWE